MGLVKSEKTRSLLSRLQQTLPEGVAVPSARLLAQGISPQLVRKYVESGWLVPLARGVYARPPSSVGWQGVVLGMQRLAQLPVHVGGLSALNLQNLSHYLPLGGETAIHLWSDAGPVRVPAWVKGITLSQELVLHGGELFEPGQEREGLVSSTTQVRDWTLIVSAPERAMMEVLSLVDETPGSFIHAAELFEGLPALRPALVQRLLVGCRNIKVKRLFMFLATRQGEPWSRKLDDTLIGLGSGKRVVTRGGRLDPRFLITVPESLSARGK
ncbi:MAG TPA: type IV toxin-antitoxin system AbiEi family antitoxin domain-containing protein [Gallionellaceae bacterium]|nr:type IV toxin-antitoxin system AbiEi family antitoxin domain-containing protein [Gallionellaceae bacterium]